MTNSSSNDQTSRREVALGLFALLGSGALGACSPASGLDPETIRTGTSELNGTSFLWVDTIGTQTSPLALRGIVGTAGQIAIAQGFWNAGDGGGGVFYWDTNVGTDNVGTFVVPGTVPTGPGWRRLVVESLNVKWFGADGTGSLPADQAIADAFLVAREGDTVFFPKGRYRIDQTVGPLPHGITLRGSGAGLGVFGGAASGSIIEYHGASGDAIEIGHFVNVNVAMLCKVEDIGIRRMNPANKTGAGLSAMGAAKITVSRCVLDDWIYGIVWDGAEQTLIEDCFFTGTQWGAEPTVADGPTYGIWFVEGPSRGRGFTVPGATNVHRVSRCDFNFPTVGLWVEGGSNIEVDNCLVNLGGVVPSASCFARVSRALNATFESCYSEGAGLAHFSFAYPVSTTSNMVTIRNHLASGACPFIKFSGAVVYNLTLQNNYLACQAIEGSGAIAGAHVSQGNYYAGGGRMYDSETSMESGFVSNIEIGVGGLRYISGTTGQPRAGFDHTIKTYDLPAFVVRTTLANHDTFSHRMISRTDGSSTPSYGRNVVERRTISHVSANTSSGVLDVHEYGVTDTAGGAIKLAAADIPSRIMGFVEARVNVVQASDESKGGSWILRQRCCRTQFGNVALLGTQDVTSVGTADTGWGPPTLQVDVATQTIHVACPSHSASAGYWFAHMINERVSP